MALVTVLARADLSKDVELLVLRHENQGLRRRRAVVFPINPATVLRRHRRLVARKCTFADRSRH
ncbi:hypothetical protein [Nonomuraea phyllanthi]|uniref:hypothetical protein n=1 Tax=Nonomuraea phyllanthi TaxID=2219224 RepID=UPI00186AE9FE|nr:hypothetical protein [Nonomuraea phyllanthi]